MRDQHITIDGYGTITVDLDEDGGDEVPYIGLALKNSIFGRDNANWILYPREVRALRKALKKALKHARRC